MIDTILQLSIFIFTLLEIKKNQNIIMIFTFRPIFIDSNVSILLLILNAFSLLNT